MERTAALGPLKSFLTARSPEAKLTMMLGTAPTKNGMGKFQVAPMFELLTNAGEMVVRQQICTPLANLA